jgi:predicted transcriptional regulator
MPLKLRKRVLENKTRRDIYNFILKYPGLHFSELSRKLDIPKSTLLFHLNYLGRCGFIAIKTEARYTRFFVEKSYGSLERKIIHILRQDTLRNIVLYIGVVGGASQAELSRELDLSTKTIERHLKRLIKVGVIEPAPFIDGLFYTARENKCVIERAPIGKEVIYRIARRPNSEVSIGPLISGLPVIYEKDLGDNGVTRYILDYLYYDRISFPDKNPPKKITTFEKSVKRIEKSLFEVFPIPFRA